MAIPPFYKSKSFFLILLYHRICMKEMQELGKKRADSPRVNDTEVAEE